MLTPPVEPSQVFCNCSGSTPTQISPTVSNGVSAFVTVFRTLVLVRKAFGLEIENRGHSLYQWVIVMFFQPNKRSRHISEAKVIRLSACACVFNLKFIPSPLSPLHFFSMNASMNRSHQLRQEILQSFFSIKFSFSALFSSCLSVSLLFISLAITSTTLIYMFNSLYDYRYLSALSGNYQPGGMW